MTRREALKVKIGDVLDSEYGLLQVTNITESKIGKPSIVFWGKDNKGLQVGYPHRICRRLEDGRTEKSNKAD